MRRVRWYGRLVPCVRGPAAIIDLNEKAEPDTNAARVRRVRWHGRLVPGVPRPGTVGSRRRRYEMHGCTTCSYLDGKPRFTVVYNVLPRDDLRAYDTYLFATSEDVPMSARHPRGRTFLAALREGLAESALLATKPYKTTNHLSRGRKRVIAHFDSVAP